MAEKKTKGDHGLMAKLKMALKKKKKIKLSEKGLLKDVKKRNDRMKKLLMEAGR